MAGPSFVVVQVVLMLESYDPADQMASVVENDAVECMVSSSRRVTMQIPGILQQDYPIPSGAFNPC